MTHDEFKLIAPKLTASLAAAIEKQLVDMGDDAKGISWFSSQAANHVKNKK